MEILLREAGIPREHSVALGDSLNDMEMLAYAGLSVAMGNALDEVKGAVDRVTAPVLENGVAKAVRQYVLNRDAAE